MPKTKTHLPKQFASTSTAPRLKLIPPLAPEFTVYGDEDTIERAREWALDGHFLLAEGVPACAHGFYMLRACPLIGSDCGGVQGWMDHTHLWVPANDQGFEHVFDRPFLLTAPYGTDDTIPAAAYAYGQAHGLEVFSVPMSDGWYAPGAALPIRLTAHDLGQLFPLEREVAEILRAWPVEWPERDPVDSLGWPMDVLIKQFERVNRGRL